MQQRQINKPISVNIDKSKKYLTPTEAFYMLNRERNINGTGTLGKTTPLVANYLACQITQPAGNNYATGHYFSELTNELYWWTFNSNGVNFIARMNGDGTCQIVYDGDCLPLSAAPEHAIEEWRCYLKYDRFCANQHGKQLIWTDGENEIGMLDVEASIATDSFRTPFFEDNCPDPCAYTQMCVPEPCGALEGGFVTLEADQIYLNNKMIDTGFKFAFIQIYYDQRESTMSDISTLYYQNSKGCFDATEGFPRCIKFTNVPLGNPLVDKIEIIFSTDNGVTWKSSDIIEKYEPYTNSAQYWYERELADLPDLDLDTCTFSYTFCNDKECNPVATTRTSRVFNPMPRQPQGMIPLASNGQTALGFYNYIKGNCPINGDEIKKFEIGLDCVSNNCAPEIVEVTVFAVVHNYLYEANGLVYRHGGANIDTQDDVKDPARFGFQYHPSGWGISEIPNEMQQVFTHQKDGEYPVRNFIAYVEGTNYWAQMEQYHASPDFTNREKVGIVSGMEIDTISMAVSADIWGGNFYYQQFKLKVPKGTKGFIRIAGHKEANGLPAEGQDKSTYVSGVIPDIRLYSGRYDLDVQGIDIFQRELYFDTCSGDVTLYEALVILDNYKRFDTGLHSSSGYSGYVTDANNRPVEGAEIVYNALRRAVTDFNGFYAFSVTGSENNQTITVDLRVERDCVSAFQTAKLVTIFGGYNLMAETNMQISNTDVPDYTTDFFEIVNVAVKDCDNQPVGGLRVALSGSKYQVTNAVTGVAEFEVRNYSTRARSVRGVVLDINNCFTIDCSDACNPCLPSTANTLLSSCFSETPYIDIVTTSNLNKSTELANSRGLKAGGRYPFAIIAKGGCGRISAAYPVTVVNGSLPALNNYVNIPKTQEKGELSFCDITYDGTGVVLPDWVDCVDVARGVNVNDYELQWVIDKIERTADRKIRLTIQSLNDYNATYNFETNTLYQFIKGDRVEFINNGDGEIFDIATFGLLNYQILSPFHDKVISGETESPADFFNQILIDDDGRLDDLTVGAKIELQHTKECTVEPTYYSVLTLAVIEISGQKVLANPTGSFRTFDTFLVTRQIENANPLESNPPQFFEHKFPSDFWGHINTEGSFLGLSDIGKVHFTNKFENERRYGRNITINSVNRFNRFGDLEKTLDAPEQGDVIAMAIYDGKIGLGIGEFDSFLFQISDEFLRVNANGMVQAAPADALVSDTQPKISGIFGCRYDSIGSIWFGDGFVTWVDKGKSSLVKHDFNVAQDISKGKFNLWVKKTIQYMENYNSTAADIDKYRWATGMNFHTGAMQLTAKRLTQSGGNNEIEPFINMSSTALIDPVSEELLTFASYLQEGYSNIVFNDSNGCAFISFLNGIPYVHPIIPIKFNEFNGVAYDTIVGVSVHHETGDKEINPMALEIQCETMWFAKKVTVDDPTFESEIPPIRWVKRMDKFNAEFLCDKNSQGGLYGNSPSIAGKKPRGYFCAVTLVRDNTTNLEYNSVNNAKRIIFDELDLVISKASFAESSGFTNNL